jgi:hypothetical protein
VIGLTETFCGHSVDAAVKVDSADDIDESAHFVNLVDSSLKGCWSCNRPYRPRSAFCYGPIATRHNGRTGPQARGARSAEIAGPPRRPQAVRIAEDGADADVSALTLRRQWRPTCL